MNTMNCTICCDKIWDYLDGPLSEAEQAEMQAHLENCETCKAEMEEIANIRKELHGLPLVELPEGYHTELMQKLQAETKVVSFKKKKERIWKPYSLIAAAVLVVAAVGGIHGIQQYHAVVLTAEEKADIKTNKTSPAEKIPVVQKEEKTSDFAELKKESQIPQQKNIQKEMPKTEAEQPKTETLKVQQPKVERPKVQQQNIQKTTSPEPLVPPAQSLDQTVSADSAAKSRMAEKTAVRADTPMPMNLRIDKEKHTEHNVNLFTEDIQQTLSALRKLGESLQIWEEGAGEDFILFSMTKGQMTTLYAKLKELGSTEMMETTEADQDTVFVKVHVMTK